MKTTIVAAAVLALVTVLPAALAVLPLPLPASVQEAQEDPCAIENDGDPTETVIVEKNGECRIVGNIDID
jgi:hypothetical protein